MSVARNILKNPKLLPGGGAAELTVSATLKQKSSSVEGVEKVLLQKFYASILLVLKSFMWRPVVCSHNYALLQYAE
jgi:chaperonin GroEL (HSP60 family)